MNIIIAGAGEVGYHLAKHLSNENHDITVVDTNNEPLERVDSVMDVLTITGSSTSIATLNKAHCDKADLVVAVTSSEAINVTTAILAKKLGAKKTIARVENAEYVTDLNHELFEQIGIDHLVYPEELAAFELVKLIQRAAATDIVEFEEGKLSLIGLKLEPKLPVLQKTILEIAQEVHTTDFRVVAIHRGLRTIIPTGNDRLLPNDQIFVITTPEGIEQVLQVVGKDKTKLNNIMFLGGGKIGRIAAKMLENDINIKLIDSDKEKAYGLADYLSKTLVIQGDGRDLDLLAQEGIIDMDGFVAVTSDAETNIITCLMAKHLGVAKTIALVDNVDYIPLTQTIGLDSLINKKLIAANNILKFIRKANIVSIATLHGIDAEVLEYIAQPHSPITKKEVKDLNFPKNAIIGGFIRDGESKITVGHTQIQANDRVVVFTLPGIIDKVEKFFSIMIKKNVILNFVGFLLILEGLFMLLGIPFSIYFNDDDIYVLLFSGLGTSLIGFLLFLYTKNKDKEIRKREGYIVVSIGWLVMSLFGAIPFVLHGSIPSYTDAFFETMSGFTTTGASILNDIESLPHGLLFWRSVTQWLGGMGMIVLSLAILPILGIGGMQLFVAEVPGPTKDKLHPRVRETAVRLWGIYAIFTLLETLLLLLGGMTFFDAICHSFTTMATGGFSTKQASIAYYQSPFIHYVIIAFMFIAGVNFTLHYHLLHGKIQNVKKNEEFKFYSFVIIFWAVVIAAILFFSGYGSAEASFRDSLFQVVSMITTTGFVTADYEQWGTFLFINIFLYFLFSGGSAGSTGGGIKIVRHLLLFKNSFLELRRLIHPRAVIPVRYNNHSVPQDIISNILAFFLFYIFIFIVGSLVMSILGLDFMSAMGSVATSLGNVGPALGSVGPTDNFSHIPMLGKWFLSFLMLLGRLELFTILVIFSPAFWKT